MASAFSIARLCLSASRRLPLLQSRSPGPVVGSRWLNTSPSRWANMNRRQRDRQEEEEEEDDTMDMTYEPEVPALSKEEEMKKTAEQLRAIGFDEKESKEMALSMISEMDDTDYGSETTSTVERELEDQVRTISIGPKPNKQSFWFDEDDPDTCTLEHDQFDEDDMTPMAHGKLDEVREMRHYARLIAWEMPLLSKFAKPFVMPKDDEVLRWRYTTYMGESHPAQKKIVVQFAVASMGLTPVQANKLRKLAGPRYDPAKDMIKMSCESFEFPAQNQRYLSDLVDKLVAEAKDPTDTFEDVPLDLRHKPLTTKPRFPIEWRLTDERRRQLEENRKATALADHQRAERGFLVDGKLELANFLARLDAEDEAAKKAQEKASGNADAPFPIPAMGGQGGGGGGSNSTTPSIDWMRAKSRGWSRR